jgi:hypothetical protein
MVYGSTKMDSTSPPRGSHCMSSCKKKMSLSYVTALLLLLLPATKFPHFPELCEVPSSFDTSLYKPFSCPPFISGKDFIFFCKFFFF